MKTSIFKLSAPWLVVMGCAGSVPPPTEQLADAQTTHRTAVDHGGQQHPRAQLHLLLAEEQIQQAKGAMAEGEDEEATNLLMRARADADLAVALAQQAEAEKAAQSAVAELNSQRAVQASSGGTK